MRCEDYKNDSIFYISSSSTTRLMINIKNWNVVNTHHVLLYWVIWFKFAYVIILFLRLSGFDSFSKMFFLKKSDIKLKEKDRSQLIWSISIYQRDGTIDRIYFLFKVFVRYFSQISLRVICFESNDVINEGMKLWCRLIHWRRYPILFGIDSIPQSSTHLSVCTSSSFEDCMIWYMTSRVIFVLSCRCLWNIRARDLMTSLSLVF